MSKKKRKADPVHKLTVQDLNHIRGIAIEFMKEKDHRNFKMKYSRTLDDHSLRTLAYCEGVLGHLRSKGLIDFKIKVSDE